MIQIGVTATEVCYLCSSPAKSGSVPIFSCGSEKKKKKVNAAGMWNDGNDEMWVV